MEQKSIDNNLFFVCSLIEFIGRKTKNKRCKIVNQLGNDLERIYNYADVFHCEPIEKVADDFVTRNNIKNGEYDNVKDCKYDVPDYWDIGDVFRRIIEDCYDKKNIITGIKEVYNSWFAERILNFNSDLYYQSREYLTLCYKENNILEY